MAADHLLGAGNRILLPGFGPCCCCEGDIPRQPRLMMLELEAPAGFKGWGCLVCRLPLRGAIAVVCESCIQAQRLPQFIAAGSDLYDNQRQRLDDTFEQKPFAHDPHAHYLAHLMASRQGKVRS
jgi:hypothetical protein